MKNNHLKGLAVRLTLCMALVGVILIIHSCRKENKLGSLPLTDSVSKAKTWYESAYPVTTGGSGSLSTLSVNGSTGNFDYSQHIKPDWEHNASYRRLGKSVIEMPMNPSNKFAAALKNNNTGKVVYMKENTKTSFIILNDGKTNEAFVMTIYAAASYIAGDPTKLAKNTYRHRDATFTGLVAYSTPKGQFIRAYAYNNGVLLGPSGSTTTAASLKAQGLTTLCDIPYNTRQAVNSVQKVNDDGAQCQDWYEVTYWDDEPIWSEYLYTTCWTCGSGDGGDGGPSNPGGGGSSPDPCGTTDSGGDQGNGGSGNVPDAITSKLAVNDIGDGMPDPTVCTTPVDPSAVADITNTIISPCLSAIVDNLTNSKTLQSNFTTMLRNTFAMNNGTVNINFSDGVLTGSNATDDANTSGSSLNNIDVEFNISQIQNASKEYLLETVMHESYHAYLDVNPTVKGNLSQHLYMAQNYINSEVALLVQLYPSLATNQSHDAYCLALGGYGVLQQTDPTAFNAVLTSYGYTASDISTTNGNYKSGTKGTHCP
jgi:hypothetical protein